MNLRAALAAILTAAVLVTSAAADVLYLPPLAVNEDTQSNSRVTLRCLQKMGLDVTVGRLSNANQDSLRFGSYQVGGPAGPWRRFDAVIFGGQLRNTYNTAKMSFDPEQFMNFSKCPFVPMLFVGAWRAGTLEFAQTASDSTGVAAGIAYTTTLDTMQVLHVVGTPYTMRLLGGARYVWGSGATAPTYGSYQCIARYKTAQFWTGVKTAWGDSIDFANANATTDSMAVWMKRFTVTGTTLKRETVNGTTFTAAPVIFCVQGAGNHSPLAIAVAKLDSLTGGHVLDYGSPIKWAMAVRRGFDWGDGTGDTPLAADSLYEAASYDSLNKLGVPFTVGIQPESLTVKSAKVTRLLALRNARFTPNSLAEMTGSGALYGNASLTNPVDAIGQRRVHKTWVGSWSDTSKAALLKARLDLVRARVGADRLDPIWMPDADLGAWGAQSRTSADSMMAILAGAGYTGILIDTKSIPNSAVRTAGTAPNYNMENGRGWYRPNRAIMRGLGRDSTYRLRLLNLHVSTIHNYFERGLIGPSVLMAPTNFAAAAGQYDNAMGADVLPLWGAGMSPYSWYADEKVPRPAFYNAKWTVNLMRACDALKWSTSRPMFRCVTLSEMAATGPNR